MHNIMRMVVHKIEMEIIAITTAPLPLLPTLLPPREFLIISRVLMFTKHTYL